VEIDPRFALANERTFLAWIRTALALLAGAVALDTVDLSWPTWVVRALATVLTVTAFASVAIAWQRWRRVDRAITAQEQLQLGPSHLVPGLGVAIVSVAVLVLILT
jgi:putative membrane protein